MSCVRSIRHQNIFMIFLFKKRSIVRREQSIRHQNIFIIFVLLEKKCRETQAVD